MAMTKTFKSGNSVAVRLPKALGIKEGTPVSVREEHGKYIIERAPEAQERISLEGIYGSCPWLKPLTPDEREFEERELDWEGKLLKSD